MKLTVLTPVKITIDEIERETAEYAKGFLRPDTVLTFVSLPEGYPCIESEAHALANGPAALTLAREAERNRADGVFINCFDDPAVYACRECMSIPVFGGYVPSVLTALGIAERIGVITTDRAGILSEERKARLMGIAGRVGAIRCADMSVLGLMEQKDQLVSSLLHACCQMYEEDRVGAVCLGCTGMAYAAGDLRAGLAEAGCPVTVVEPVAAALTWLERTVALGQSDSLGLRIDL